MNTDKALVIIRALAEEYPADSPYQSPQTVRALFMATQALERTKKADDKLRKRSDNAGKAWDDEEDRRLIKAFDSGQTTKQLAEEHQRTEGSIRSRLMKQGRM